MKPATDFNRVKNPGILKMIRAPFLSSILAPVFAGTLLAVSINGHLYILEFILVTVTGIGLHVATNVYNDIYDTLQGTDKVNVHRNESSGGSGVLLDNPGLMGQMFFLARSGLAIALAGTLLLSFRLPAELRPYLWALFLLSAFFSKYYTAPPFKLAYRGLGEISVWLAFGPMAILIAVLGQGIGFHPLVLLLMPATGLSTSSILLVGQMIDIDADRSGGKHGVASRMGTRFTAYLYIAVQAAIIANIVLISFAYPGTSWIFVFILIPYLLLFPTAATIITTRHDNPDHLKKGAKLTVLIHLAFSVLLIATFLVYILIN
jgi:1,4-dihydroxy-2-naphthoate octaprenyltransferase